MRADETGVAAFEHEVEFDAEVELIGYEILVPFEYGGPLGEDPWGAAEVGAELFEAEPLGDDPPASGDEPRVEDEPPAAATVWLEPEPTEGEPEGEAPPADAAPEREEPEEPIEDPPPYDRSGEDRAVDGLPTADDRGAEPQVSRSRRRARLAVEFVPDRDPDCEGV